MTRVSDLMVAWTTIPRDSRDAFFEVYGEVDDLTIQMGAIRASITAAPSRITRIGSAMKICPRESLLALQRSTE